MRVAANGLPAPVDLHDIRCGLLRGLFPFVKVNQEHLAGLSPFGLPPIPHFVRTFGTGLVIKGFLRTARIHSMHPWRDPVMYIVRRSLAKERAMAEALEPSIRFHLY